MSDFSDTNILRKIFNAIPGILKPVLIRGQKQRWKDDFNGTSLSNEWEIVKNSGNGYISVGGGEVTINTGTAIGSTAIRSIKSFQIPCKAAFAFRTSGKNNSQRFKMSVVNALGTNYARFVVTTSTVTIDLETSNSPFLINTSSINLGINTVNTGIVEVEMTIDETKFSALAPNTVGGKQQTIARHTRIPLSSEIYFLEIETENPAATSNSSFIVDFASFQENEIIQSELTAVRSNRNLSDSILVSPGTSVFSASVNNSFFPVNNITSYTNDSSTALSANGSVTTSVKDMSNKGVFMAFVNTDVPGNLYIEQSPDNVAWFTTSPYPCIAGGNNFRLEPASRFVRCRYVNGSTAQTTFRLYSLIKSF